MTDGVPKLSLPVPTPVLCTFHYRRGDPSPPRYTLTHPPLTDQFGSESWRFGSGLGRGDSSLDSVLLKGLLPSPGFVGLEVFISSKVRWWGGQPPSRVRVNISFIIVNSTRYIASFLPYRNASYEVTRG